MGLVLLVLLLALLVVGIGAHALWNLAFIVAWIYGVVKSFQAHWLFGLVSLFIAPVGVVVGIVSLIMRRNAAKALIGR